MILYTYQSDEVYRKLLKNEVVRSDARRVDRDFRLGYAWMREQLALRLTDYRGPSIMWAWVDRLDMRRFRHWTPCWELKINIDPSRKLLSSESLWIHGLLAGCDLFLENEVPDDYDVNKLVWGNLHDAQGDPVSIALGKTTWPRIFDLDFAKKFDKYSMTQACFEELRIDDVVRARFYPGRQEKA